jgi:hypothetical protein
MELLVVMVIVTVLAIAGVAYLGSRPATGVRTLLDEIEGALLDAHKQAVATGRDVTIATAGTWNGATPMALVRGDATINAAGWTAAFAAANGTWPPPQGTMTPGQYSSLSLGFRLGTTPNGGLSRDHMNAGVAVDLAAWWDVVNATPNTKLETVDPFASVAGFATQVTGTNRVTNRLFTGALAALPNTGFSISGTNKRFNQTFWIPVVAISNGNAVPGGPMGVLFVQGNGATIYKFYNPGTRGGDGKWRRI